MQKEGIIRFFRLHTTLYTLDQIKDLTNVPIEELKHLMTELEGTVDSVTKQGKIFWYLIENEDR